MSSLLAAARGPLLEAVATYLSPMLGKLVWVQVPEAHWPLQSCPPGHTPPHWAPGEHLGRQYLSPVFGQLVWVQVNPVLQTPVLRTYSVGRTHQAAVRAVLWKG